MIALELEITLCELQPAGCKAHGRHHARADAVARAIVLGENCERLADSRDVLVTIGGCVPPHVASIRRTRRCLTGIRSMVLW